MHQVWAQPRLPLYVSCLSVCPLPLSLSICVGCWQLLGWSGTSLHSETWRFIPFFRNNVAAESFEFLNAVRAFQARWSPMVIQGPFFMLPIALVTSRRFLILWDLADAWEPPELYTVHGTVAVDICTVVKSMFSRNEMSLLWSWTKCRKFIRKFRNALVPNRLVIYQYRKLFGASGSIWDRKRERRRHFWYKHLDEI